MFFMAIINWQLALIVLAIMPVLMYHRAFSSARRSWWSTATCARSTRKITGAYNENITGVRVVKALGREDENLREFRS